jgi:hypothetical protein
MATKMRVIKKPNSKEVIIMVSGIMMCSLSKREGRVPVKKNSAFSF